MTDKTIKSPGKRKNLGEILLEDGVIDSEVLSNALDIQGIKKELLGDILVGMGAADQITVAEALSRQTNLPFVRLDEIEIGDDVISLFTPAIVEKHLAIPIEKQKSRLVLAMANPMDHQAIDDFQFISQMYVSIVVAPKKDILVAIKKYYPDSNVEEDLENDQDTDGGVEVVKRDEPDEEGSRDLLDLAELPPVVRFTNIMIANAIKTNASDIHVEPKKKSISIRCRIDGIMEETMKAEKHVHAPLVSRIKIISGMDISIRRKPQDGKAQVLFGGKQYDLRVSTLPTSEGEKVTMRILNPDSSKIQLEDLGFAENDFKRFTDAISVSQGIVLVTGPTGSGKSSTLYACLNRLNTPEVNIITVEDPVEFDVQGINQVQINPRAGITFAAGLRSILRQDPDIVLVGEIRDKETASVSFQAAQTGHLVLSTLHTNDAPSALTRLVDLDVDEFIVFDSVVAVLGQRLVRRICQKCKAPDNPDPQMMERIRPVLDEGEKPAFWKGAGCDACNNKGYTGRMALFETLIITPTLKKVLQTNVSALEIKNAALKEGYKTLTLDGLKKAMEGLTTIDEVFRVAPPEMTKDSEDVGTEGDTGEKTVPTHDTGASLPETPGMPEMPDMPKVPAMPEAPKVPEMPDISADPNASQATAYRTTPPPEKPPFALNERPPFVADVPTVLIVEDNMVTRELIKKILLSNNYQVLAAENGIQALEIISQQKPDLILTDFHMPQMDGITLVKKLKSNPSTADIPIIMLTAEEQADAEVEVLGAGADDYLIKPVDPKRFVARVRKHLNA